MDASVTVVLITSITTLITCIITTFAATFVRKKEADAEHDDRAEGTTYRNGDEIKRLRAELVEHGIDPGSAADQ